MNTFDEWCGLLHAYSKALGKKSLKKLHVHLSGIAYGPKGEKEHLKLEEADLDLKALMRALQECGGGGRILCESPIMEEDALNMKKAWFKVSGEKDS
jgi:deoxyribonuclease-4